MPEKPFKLASIISGKGPIVVLLHGFLESHTMWEALELSTIFKTIAIDLPGHGSSKNEPTVTSIEQMATCVKLTLDELDINEFHLIGHSMGGYVALEFLKQFGLNGKMILLNSNFWQDDAKKKADRLRVANLVLKNKRLFIREAIPGLFSDPTAHTAEIQTLIKEAFDIPAEHIAACSVAMRNRDNHLVTIKKEAKKISILQGETDKLCSTEKMEIAVEGLEISYLKVPKAGHMSHFENTSFVRNAILEIILNEN
jgi:pimeloyl-ACP methyl ester carboxylesterase